MDKHTPGPWKVNGADNAIVGQRDGLPECIGQVFNVVHGRSYPNEWSPVSSANARLIAAAPRMLDLIRDVLNDDDNSVSNPYAERARAILRDVKGS